MPRTLPPPLIDVYRAAEIAASRAFMVFERHAASMTPKERAFLLSELKFSIQEKLLEDIAAKEFTPTGIKPDSLAVELEKKTVWLRLAVG